MMKHDASTLARPPSQCVRWCCCSTRELADQVAQQVKLYARHQPAQHCGVYGMDMKPQTAELKRRGGAGAYARPLAGPY
jgi:superfamily II DNA/RNA helicase